MNKFFQALRPKTLFGSISAFLAAAALAFLDSGRLPPETFAASLLGLVLLHISMNLIFQAMNPGEGSGLPQAGARETGANSASFRWILIGPPLVCFAASLGLGFWLAGQGRPMVLLWGTGGVAAGLAYIFVPPRLRRLGLGQVAVLLGFGPLLTGGGYYSLTGNVTLASALIGLPQALLLVAVLWADPLPDRSREHKDKEGKPLREDSGPAPITFLFHLGLSFAALAALVLLARVTGAGITVLLGLAVAPLALSAALELRNKNLTPEPVKRARAKTLLSHLALSLLLIIALVGERYLRT